MNAPPTFSFLLPLATTLAAAAQTQLPAPVDAPAAAAAARTRTASPHGFARVLHEAVDANVHRAGGDDWKATFDRGGFTFVPFLGADAERTHPTTFRVAAVRVGGRDVAFDAHAAPMRERDRVEFRRGPLREVYDLSPRGVAQSFVLDTAWPGDVEVELRVATDLRECDELPGIQFGNARGGVAYGDAFLVRGAEQLPITTTWRDGAIRLHVPAALRGDGPVVIDPLVSTFTTGFTPSFPRPSSAPDVAFDVSGNVFMVVWESQFAVGDVDVFCEMSDGDGNLILGSGAALDFSSLSYTQPAIGNCNASDLFLVAVTKVDPALHQGRAMIVGRTRPANPTAPLSPEFAISDPLVGGASQHREPDVGGDSAPTAGPLGFVVVWTCQPSGNTTIRTRRFLASGAPAGADDQLLGGPTPLYSARISSSNGRGHVPEPSWMVVFSSAASNGVDVMGMVLNTSGQNVGFFNVDNDFDDDRYPSVSSPVTPVAGSTTLFLVTYEQQAPLAAKAVVFHRSTMTLRAPTDLTASFGFGTFWLRAESDGTRFAVTCTTTPAASTIGAATLAYDGFGLRVHEHPRALAGTASYPRLTSKHASGGPATSYAVAYVDSATTPARTRVALYEGYQPGVQIMQHTIACDGLQLQWAGQPLLTQSMQFTLSNFGGNLPAVAFGFPATPTIPLCATCTLGVRPDQPVSLTFAPSLLLAIPPDVALVDRTFAVQGLSLGGGSCLGGLSFSDMIEFTIR